MNSSLNKFNGKLEVPTTNGSSEMGKEEFIEFFKNRISYYGVQIFNFYLPNFNKNMIYLLS